MFLSQKCEALPPPVPPSTRSEEAEAFLPADNPAPASPPPQKRSVIAQISPSSRKTLLRLCCLFFFDSLASGMVPNSLIAFYISRKFSLPEGKLGSIIGSAQFLSSIGNVFASAIAKRIGLVKTMVFTHLPSAILLSLVPLPGSLAPTVFFLVVRASLASMDQAPRSAFLSAVVLPGERTAVMGVVNTVKTLSQSSGPLITGLMADGGRFWIAFLLAGSLKALYDLGLLTVFLNHKVEGEENVTGRVETEMGLEFELESESKSESRDAGRHTRGREGTRAS
jgi:predicted MFS family arabinose efflux permease